MTNKIKAQDFPPGLINPDEIDMLIRIVSQLRPTGAIVEAGAFFGASTCAMIEGLKRNPHIPDDQKTGLIHSFDKFEYGHWVHPRFIPRGQMQKGDSFRHIFEENLAGNDRFVTIQEGDILDCANWTGGAIALLFLDICKTPAINDKVQDLFFPHLQPGSLLIQQDYIAPTLNIWLYATMQKLSHCFEIVEYCDVNSVVYRCLQTPSAHDIRNIRASNMTHSERIALAELEMTDWEKRSLVSAEQIQYAILHYRKAVAMNRYGIRPVRSDPEKARQNFAPQMPF